jgi:hypothetical protein
VCDASFGPYNINEMIWARELIPRVAGNSITVFDKGFMSAQLLYNLVARGENRHFIIPARSNTRWEALSGREGAAVTRLYDKLPALLSRLHERLKQLTNEKRPGRFCAQAVKSRPFRYTVRYLKRDLN